VECAGRRTGPRRYDGAGRRRLSIERGSRDGDRVRGGERRREEPAQSTGRRMNANAGGSSTGLEVGPRESARSVETRVSPGHRPRQRELQGQGQC
jgi:hypothetical protein